MRIQPGARLGRYEVVAHIGAGGMGEVYRARDTHLDKQVALKTIAAGYSRDPASQVRFDLERRLSAALEHPHICRLLDAGEQDGVAYLAMELLDGESLAERLKRGPLPPAAAVGYAIEIADALDYAHRHGVVHRDLKPANVFLTRTGAKVLDFGLAKLRPPGRAAAEVREATVPLDISQAGMLVGSAPYMAPERLEGYDADHRTDVFAFGVLLYEMLTGRRAFAGNTTAALIAAILSQEAAPLGLAGPHAADLEWLVRKCLAKKPDDRWQSMADVQIVLKRVAAAGFAPAVRRKRRRRTAIAAAVLVPLALGAIGWAALGATRTREVPPPIALTIVPPPGGAFTPTEGSNQTAQLALSPDGRSLVYVAAGADGVARLWLQRFSATVPNAIPGTEDAKYPFWSPDGKSIGFFTADALRRVDLSGGPPRTIAATKHGRGGTWSAAGDILFAPSTTGTIMRVPAGSEGVVDATRLDEARSEGTHRWPHFLPDGRRFLYYSRAGAGFAAHEGVYCTSLDGDTPKLVANTSAGAVFVPPDRLLYLGDGTLLTRAFDPKTCTAHGDPTPVAERVGSSSNFYGAFSASAAGAIAYARDAMTSDLVWVDRAGRRGDVIAAARQHVDFRLSPDGHAVAIAEIDNVTNGADIYVLDLARKSRERIVDARGTDASPVWSPDGSRIVFRSNRERVHDLYMRDASGSGPEIKLEGSGFGKYPTSWARDGRVAFHTRNTDAKWDIEVSVVGDRPAPQRFPNTRHDEFQAQFSPDGERVAFTSNVSGDHEVLLLDGGEQTTVSINGGDDPRWRADGRELFYISAKGQLMAVAIPERGARVSPSVPQPLFTIRNGGVTAPFTSVYDVAPDGQRFLIRVPLEDVRSTPLIVLLNWSLHARE